MFERTQATCAAQHVHHFDKAYTGSQAFSRLGMSLIPKKEEERHGLGFGCRKAFVSCSLVALCLCGH